MITKHLKKLMQGENLTFDECQNAATAILTDAAPEQVAAFLVLLHSKGETADELFAFMKVMQEKMLTITLKDKVLDIVGTGGDGAHTINISTAAAVLAASCNVKVVKHGNRSISSRCGSADLLEALGMNIELSIERLTESINTHHLGFCYAPKFHPLLAKIKTIRTFLGVPTTFNLLGPLLNPARAAYLLIGVAKEQYLPLFADVLQKTAVERALVVHSCGLDELSLLGPSTIIEIHKGYRKQYILNPVELGFKLGKLADIQGGDAEFNAQQILDVFRGKKNLIADTLIFNAAAGLYTANAVSSIRDGVVLARNSLTSGLAMQTLEKLIIFSNYRGKMDE